MQTTRKIVAGATLLAAVAVGGTGVAMASGGGDGGNGNDPADQPITGPALQQASDAAVAAAGGGKVTATEVGDEESYYQVEVTLDDGSQVDVQLDKDFKVVSQKNEGTEKADDQGGESNDHGDRQDANDPADQPIAAPALQQASDAAIAAAGGGKVTATEVGDGKGAGYKVEVTLDDGSTVDVELDKDFKVLKTDNEGTEKADDSNGSGEANDHFVQD